MNEMKARSARPELSSGSHDSAQAVCCRETVLESLERKESLAVMRALVQDALDDVEKKVMVLHFAQEIGLDAITRLLRLNNPSGARAYVLSAKRKLAAAAQRFLAKEQNVARWSNCGR